MNFVKSPVSLAVSTALLFAAASASAYVPTSNTDTDLVVYWAGATASSLSAQELAINSLCDTDTDLLYVKAAANDAPGNDWALACRTAAAGATVSGLPTGLRILVIKRDRGGSGVGVGPLQVNQTIPFLTVNATNCSIPLTAGVNGAPAIGLPGGAPGTFVPLTGCTATYTTSALVEMGTSDIEPSKFFGINTPVVDVGSGNVGFPFVNGTGFKTQVSLAGLAFNTPVTLNMYRALQTAQFGAGSVCNPANVDFNTVLPAVPGVNPRTDVTNAESEACMPSLTRQEINSILTGKVVTWNQLLNAAGTAVLPAQAVQICRRVEGSGTQATMNALIGNWPCDANAADNAIDIITPRNTASAALLLNSGAGDVDNCLNTFNGTANPNAIGVLSIEGRNVQKNRGWRYIKIDGVAPTLKNIHGGDYWLWSQQSAQLRLDPPALTANTPIGASDSLVNKATVFTALTTGANGLNSLPTLRKLNLPPSLTNCTTGANLSECGSLYTFGQSGWLATPNSGLLYDTVLSVDPANAAQRPVNVYTREVTAGRVNICQTPTKSTAGGNAAKGTIVTTP
jgi:hypothetical protein